MTKNELKQVYADWIDREAKPNTAVVLTLKKRSFDREGNPLWGNAAIYENEVKLLRIRLSERLFGKTNCRRHKRSVAFVPVAEGSMRGLIGQGWKPTADGRPHIHLMVRRPDWCEHDAFAMALRYEWIKSEWAFDRTYVEPISGNWTKYCLKDGPDALLIDAMSF